MQNQGRNNYFKFFRKLYLPLFSGTFGAVVWTLFKQKAWHLQWSFPRSHTPSLLCFCRPREARAMLQCIFLLSDSGYEIKFHSFLGFCWFVCLDLIRRLAFIWTPEQIQPRTSPDSFCTPISNLIHFLCSIELTGRNCKNCCDLVIVYREVMLEKQLTGHRVDRSICDWFWEQTVSQADSTKVPLTHDFFVGLIFNPSLAAEKNEGNWNSGFYGSCCFGFQKMK